MYLELCQAVKSGADSRAWVGPWLVSLRYSSGVFLGGALEAGTQTQDPPSTSRSPHSRSSGELSCPEKVPEPRSRPGNPEAPLRPVRSLSRLAHLPCPGEGSASLHPRAPHSRRWYSGLSSTLGSLRLLCGTRRALMGKPRHIQTHTDRGAETQRLTHVDTHRGLGFCGGNRLHLTS